LSQEQIGYVDLLRGNADYRRLFFARLASLFGDWFNLLAILALLRAIGADSASAFGGALILKSLPTIAISPYAGLVADRFSRKKIMIASDLLRAAVVLCFFLALIFPSAWFVYALVMAQSALSGFFEPAKTALLPDIVDPRELTSANALGAASWSAMLTVGAAAGGLVTEYLGWQAALGLDALTYLLSAFLLWGVAEPQQEKVPRKEGGWSQTLEGFAYMRSRVEIWTLVLCKSGWNIAGGVTLMLTILGEGKFSLGGKAILGVTVLYMARGLGTGIGPILSRALSRSEPAAMDRMIGLGYLCGAFFYLFIPWAGNIWTAGVLILLAHLGGATVWVFSIVRLQQQVPPEVRGRVFAADQAGFTLMFALSTALYGWLADSWGVEPTHLLAVMGGSLLLPAIGWWLRQRHIAGGGGG
jgi:MFS family permease